ncbi:50S ribosomal protein L18 [Candidatus Woesearchaeota archaeon]|nr:50S ribosomal protein L18 [Candidatus Woesearchaeota archaeon]
MRAVPYRRKREGRTNYKKRLILLQSKVPRLIIRKTNTQVILQIAEYDIKGDKILCGISSSALMKLGWKYSCKNTPAYYLAGLLVAKKALQKKIKVAIVDVGLQTSGVGSKIYACVKGAIDAGLEIPVSEDAFPSEDRIIGKNIFDFFTINKNQSQFADYKKQGTDLKKFQSEFESLKKKILSG